MKKIILIITGVVIILLSSLVILYNVNLSAVKKESEQVSFVIESGTSTQNIIKNLKEANLIKNELVTKIYVKLNSINKIQAGTFTLNRNMDVEDIFKTLENKGMSDNTFRITFKEGDTLEKYVEQISESLNKDKEDLLKEINSQEFLTPLIEKYWFLTDDILKEGIYYPLEGYLYPNTYEFYQNTDLKTIVTKMLDETYKQMDAFKIAINEGEHNVHDILTMASIIEKEAVREEDRKKVSQVIYKRLSLNMSLGMDVTAYYGVRKNLTEPITALELNDNNPYNTRVTSFKGLPIGPICNPSKTSIRASLHPSNTNYVYFFADVKTKEVHFTDSYKEFQTFKEIYG